MIRYMVGERFADNGELDCHVIIDMDTGKEIGVVEELAQAEPLLRAARAIKSDDGKKFYAKRAGLVSAAIKFAEGEK